jgi:hypothetical protein
MMRMRRRIPALMIVISIIGSLFFTASASFHSTGGHPPFTFSWTECGEDFTGGVDSLSGTLYLDRTRISFYDTNKKLMESGLLSEYSANRSFGQYLEFRDINENGKLDVIDVFIISGAVYIEEWGIVVTYEPIGKSLYSRTISNEPFSISEELEKENDRDIFILIFLMNVGGLLLILVNIYTRKN